MNRRGDKIRTTSIPADNRGPDRPILVAALTREWPALLLATLALPFIVYGLGSYSLVNTDEEIYHTIARQMLESGNWLRLQFYDTHMIYDTFMNAPLQYWARAIVIWAFGSSEWTVRILSALLAVASLIATYRLTHHLSQNRATAFLAGLIQLTTLQFIYLHGARTGELEPALVLLYTVLALLFLRGIQTGGPFTAHHVCLALLLNVKTPTVLVPLLAEALCFAVLPAARPALRRFARSALVIVPLGLVWHVLCLLELWQPFLSVLERMFGEATAHKGVAGSGGHWENAVYYVQTVLFGAYPYSLVYPLAVLGVLFADRNRDDGLGWRIVGLFILAVFAFFIAVSKHNRWYIMLAYPLLSAFVAHALIRLWSLRASVPLLAGIGATASVFAFTAIDLADYDPFARKAMAISMETRWISLGGLDPAWGIPVLALFLFGALFALRRLLSPRFRHALAAAAVVGLVGYASVRVVLPLRFLDHQSAMAQLRSQLDLERELAHTEGRRIAYPIQPRLRFDWDRRFYLADRYELVRERGYIALYPKHAIGVESEQIR